MEFHRQGSAGWFAARLGKVTASRFADVCTQPRSKADKEAGVLSQTAQSYFYELVGEHLTGIPAGADVQAKALEWGHQHEPQARDEYTFRNGVKLVEIGFAQHKSIELVGGSPDAYIGDDHGVEIKCPYTSREHARYLVEPGTFKAKYAGQVQGLMWITGRTSWDLVSFDPRVKDHPELRLLVVECKVDHSWFERFESLVVPFAEQLKATLERMGVK